MGGKGGGGGGQVVGGPTPEAARVAGQFQVDAAEQASLAAQEQTIRAIEELRRQTETGRADLAPQRLAGFGALDLLSQTLGLPTPVGGSAGVADLFGQNAQLVNEVGVAPGAELRKVLDEKALANSGVVNSGGQLRPDAIKALNAAGIGGNVTSAVSGQQFQTSLDRGGVDEIINSVLRSSGMLGGATSIGADARKTLVDKLNEINKPPEPLEGPTGLPGQGGEPGTAGTDRLFNFSDVELQQSDPGDLFDLIRNTPGFQFEQEEASKALQRSAAARGSLQSGNTLKELQTLGQNIGATRFGDFQNRLSQLAGLGVGANTTTAGLSQGLGSQAAGQFGQLGNTLANAQLATGQARASSHLAGNQQFQTIGGGGGGGIGDILGGVGSLVGAFKCAKIYKTNMEELNHDDILGKLDRMVVEKWNYKEEDTKHISPYAEDFAAIFGVGDGRTIHPVDLFGVMLSSIKALSDRVKELEGK